MSGQPSFDVAVEIVRAAERAGVRAIDTAPVYGSAEHIVGAGARTTPVFTKFDPATAPGPSIVGSLERLRRSQVDVAFIHDAATLEHDATGYVDRAHALVGGPIGALGASIYTPEQFELAVDDPRISVIQAPISAADGRLSITGLLGRAAEAGKTVVARSVFLQGALMLPAARLPNHLLSLTPLLGELDELAAGAGMTRSQLLVSFVRDMPAVGALLLGCETLDQLTHNLDLMAGPPIPLDVWTRIQMRPSLDLRVVDPRGWPK
jgi:aryl-alcohol dehydrogenase-like predicted oxidoreductase